MSSVGTERCHNRTHAGLWLGSVENFPEFTCSVLLYTTENDGLERGCCSDVDVLDSGRPTRLTIGDLTYGHVNTGYSMEVQ